MALYKPELLQHPGLIPLLPSLYNHSIRKAVDDHALNLHAFTCRRDVP